MDHLGIHTIDIGCGRKLLDKTRSLIPSGTVYEFDPRTHLNGPFVSLRKIQKHQECGRLQILEERRNKLRCLIKADRQKWQCELSQMGLTLYTDTLL